MKYLTTHKRLEVLEEVMLPFLPSQICWMFVVCLNFLELEMASRREVEGVIFGSKVN